MATHKNTQTTHISNLALLAASASASHILVSCLVVAPLNVCMCVPFACSCSVHRALRSRSFFLRLRSYYPTHAGTGSVFVGTIAVHVLIGVSNVQEIVLLMMLLYNNKNIEDLMMLSIN